MFKKIIDTITDSLRVKNNEIIGNIYNLEKKLNGEIPITRLELLVLVSSWGRTSIFYTNIKDDKVLIKEKNKGKSFDLSKLDTSEITDMSSIFRGSNFNGDISNWNTSNVTDMSYMFCGAEKFNQVVNFNTSKVTSMEWMFYNARKFNQPLNFDTSKVTSLDGMFYNASSFNQELNFNTSNVISMYSMFNEASAFNQPLIFNTSNVITMERMFCDADAFKDKYNNGNSLPYYTEDIKLWLEKNSEKMNVIDIKDTHGKELDDFFSKFTNINIEINSIQRKEI